MNKLPIQEQIKESTKLYHAYCKQLVRTIQDSNPVSPVVARKMFYNDEARQMMLKNLADLNQLAPITLTITNDKLKYLNEGILK